MEKMVFRNLAVMERQRPGEWAGHLRSTVTGRANSSRYHARTQRELLAILRGVAKTAPPASDHVKLAARSDLARYLADCARSGIKWTPETAPAGGYLAGLYAAAK